MPDLISHSYIFLTALEVLLCAAVALNFTELLAALKGVPRGRWLLLGAVFLAGGLLRFYFVPHRFYVFYDEYEHVSIARNMLANGLFSNCDFFLDGKCYSSWLPHKLPGYHFLLSQFMSLFGAGGQAPFLFNSLVSSFSIPLVFLLAWFAFQDASAALISGLLLAFLPLHLKFAGNASTETLSLFFLLLASAAWFYFNRRLSGRSLFLALAATAWALMIRVENGLLLALFPVFIALTVKDRRALRPLLWAIPAVAVPYLLYLPGIRSVVLSDWIGARAHVPVLGLCWSLAKYWCSDISVPLSVTAAAAASAYALFRTRKAELGFFVVYFLAFAAVYACGVKLDLSNTDSQRFNLSLLLPAVVLASVSLSGVLAWAVGGGRLKRAAAALLFLAVGADYAGCFGFVKSEISAPAFVSDYAALSFAGGAGKDPVYVAYSPAFPITVLGASSVHISYMSDRKVFDAYLKGRNLVLLDDYWCRRDAEKFCAELKRRFRLPALAPGADAPGLRLYQLK